MQTYIFTDNYGKNIDPVLLLSNELKGVSRNVLCMKNGQTSWKNIK